jgi:hypothetical protein
MWSGILICGTATFLGVFGQLQFSSIEFLVLAISGLSAIIPGIRKVAKYYSNVRKDEHWVIFDDSNHGARIFSYLIAHAWSKTGKGFVADPYISSLFETPERYSAKDRHSVTFSIHFDKQKKWHTLQLTCISEKAKESFPEVVGGFVKMGQRMIIAESEFRHGLDEDWHRYISETLAIADIPIPQIDLLFYRERKEVSSQDFPRLSKLTNKIRVLQLPLIPTFEEIKNGKTTIQGQQCLAELMKSWPYEIDIQKIEVDE